MWPKSLLRVFLGVIALVYVCKGIWICIGLIGQLIQSVSSS